MMATNLLPLSSFEPKRRFRKAKGAVLGESLVNSRQSVFSTSESKREKHWTTQSLDQSKPAEIGEAYCVLKSRYQRFDPKIPPILTFLF